MLGCGMPPFPDGHPRPGLSRIVRYGPKRGAWYRLYEHIGRDGKSYISGAFGWWGKIDATKIEPDLSALPAPDRSAMLRRQREAADREESRRAERAHNAANRARQQWQGAEPNTGPWPYLDRKRVTPEAVRCVGDGTLLVPMHRVDGDAALVGLQKIAPDGSKRYTRGMAKEGSACRLGSLLPVDPIRVVMIGEGYATCRSVRMALREKTCVYVAFDAVGLLPVARAVRQRYPDAHILMLADDDYLTEGNPGVTRATVAADAVGRADGKASVVIPRFRERVDKLTDFNDLHVAEGLAAVEAQLLPAVINALRLLAGAQVDHEEPAAPRDPAEPSGPPPGHPAARDDEASVPPAAGRGASSEVRLSKSGQGGAKPTLGNVTEILAKDEHWRGVLALNEFSGDVVKLRPPPFDFGAAGPWVDMDDIRTMTWLEAVYGLVPKKETVIDAVREVSSRKTYHPVRDWLKAQVWDGIERLETWAIDCLGAPDTPYVRSASKKWMVQAINRIFVPGCKADNVLILEGEQGARKSTALRKLAVDWYTDTPLKIGDKEAYLLIQGVWIVELAELDSFSRADSSAAKLFFSQNENHYRPWYGIRPIKVKRQCVFAGTVNNDNYLKDDTGNRRYWPIRCGKIDIPLLESVVPQLWAEARNVFETQKDFKYWVDVEEKALFEEEQAERYVSDVYTDVIRKWMAEPEVRMEMDSKEFGGFGMDDIMKRALRFDTPRMTRAEGMRVGHCLRELGFVRMRASVKGTKERPWVYRLRSRVDQRVDSATEKVGTPDEDLPI